MPSAYTTPSSLSSSLIEKSFLSPAASLSILINDVSTASLRYFTLFPSSIAAISALEQYILAKKPAMLVSRTDSTKRFLACSDGPFVTTHITQYKQSTSIRSVTPIKPNTLRIIFFISVFPSLSPHCQSAFLLPFQA